VCVCVCVCVCMCVSVCVCMYVYVCVGVCVSECVRLTTLVVPSPILTFCPPSLAHGQTVAHTAHIHVCGRHSMRARAGATSRTAHTDPRTITN